VRLRTTSHDQSLEDRFTDEWAMYPGDQEITTYMRETRERAHGYLVEICTG
jgi:hypothetical protein